MNSEVAYNVKMFPIGTIVWPICSHNGRKQITMPEHRWVGSSVRLTRPVPAVAAVELYKDALSTTPTNNAIVPVDMVLPTRKITKFSNKKFKAVLFTNHIPMSQKNTVCIGFITYL